ncbi:MAG: peroxiredoxin-like family protein [Planctomycetota bacterium]
MSTVLWAAAVYNVLWGAWVVALPNTFFDWTGMARPTYPSIWQCVGMIVGVYGLGYAFAARDPLRHWPIVFVGFLGKVFGPIGYVDSAWVRQTLDPAFGWTIPTNDLIWWAPFAMILWASFRHAQGIDEQADPDTPDRLAERFDQTPLSERQTLGALSRDSPVVLLLLRHLGCTFCREALQDLREALPALRDAGVTPVVVHMSEPDSAEPQLHKHGLQSIAHVSDPERDLYRALGLTRGGFNQLFGPRVFVRGAKAAAKGCGVGKLEGDGFQLGGAFLIRDGRVVAGRPCRDAADRIDLVELAGPVAGSAVQPSSQSSSQI